MTWKEALEIVVGRTGHERYRYLCAEHPDPATREQYRRLVIEMADRPAPAYPSITTQAASLARALWDWGLSGFAVASDGEQARRRSICAGCPRWDAAARRCVLCGCATDYKTAMRTEHCPEAKW